MKLIAIILASTVLLSIGRMIGYLEEKSKQDEKTNQLRKERDMYDSLYRAANTRLAHFQDSINCHCICK